MHKTINYRITWIKLNFRYQLLNNLFNYILHSDQKHRSTTQCMGWRKKWNKNQIRICLRKIYGSGKNWNISNMKKSNEKKNKLDYFVIIQFGACACIPIHKLFLFFIPVVREEMVLCVKCMCIHCVRSAFFPTSHSGTFCEFIFHGGWRNAHSDATRMGMIMFSVAKSWYNQYAYRSEKEQHYHNY